MGSIINAHCDCGFDKNEMFLGGGMMNFMKYCNYPFYCENCSILFEGNVFDKKLKCPKCNKDHVSSYDTKKTYSSEEKETVFDWNVMDEIGRKLELTDENYFCPGCREFTLRFSNCGSWD